jgi:hypothetical protein
MGGVTVRFDHGICHINNVVMRTIAHYYSRIDAQSARLQELFSERKMMIAQSMDYYVMDRLDTEDLQVLERLSRSVSDDLKAGRLDWDPEEKQNDLEGVWRLHAIVESERSWAMGLMGNPSQRPLNTP